MNLKIIILNYYQEIWLTDISLNIVDLVIENENEIVGYLTISGYEHLQSIKVNKESLMNILSLTIKNNPLLKIISLDDNACENTRNVTLSSYN